MLSALTGLHHCTPPRLNSDLWGHVGHCRVLHSNPGTYHVLISVLHMRDTAVSKTDENSCLQGVSIQAWKYGQ